MSLLILLHENDIWQSNTTRGSAASKLWLSKNGFSENDTINLADYLQLSQRISTYYERSTISERRQLVRWDISEEKRNHVSFLNKVSNGIVCNTILMHIMYCDRLSRIMATVARVFPAVYQALLIKNFVPNKKGNKSKDNHKTQLLPWLQYSLTTKVFVRMGSPFPYLMSYRKHNS